MFLLKVAAAALNQTPLDWERNKRNILSAIEEARGEGVSVLCLPELCITGYGCEDAFLSPGVHGMALEVLGEVLPATEGMIVSLGLPVMHDSAVYNACCVVADRKILGFVAKRALAGDGIHYEPRWFKPWPGGRRSTLKAGGQSYPIGDLYFDCGGVKIGFEICEDAWIAQRPGAELSLDAVDLILNPSASHFAFGKHRIRRRLVLEGSRAFGVSYVYANLLGNEAGRPVYDGDTLIASGGSVVSEGRRFSFADHQLITAVVDIDLMRTRRASLSSFHPHVAPEPGECVCVDFAFPAVEPEPQKVELEPWEHSQHKKEEEFMRAIALSLFDYMRKSRSRGFVVSMSGGADSSAVACLVGLMAKAFRWGVGHRRRGGQAGLHAGTGGREQRARARRAASDHGLPGDRAQLEDHARRGALCRCLCGRAPSRARRAAAGRRLREDDRERRRSAARLGARRHRAAEHPGAGTRAGRVDAGESGGQAAARDQQPLGSGRRLRDDGRRHGRRGQPHRRHRQGVPAPLAILAGKTRAHRRSSRCRSCRS